MPRFRFIGFRHADELATGRPLVVGDEVELKGADVDANSRLIDEGLLIELEDPKPSKTKTRRTEESDK